MVPPECLFITVLNHPSCHGEAHHTSSPCDWSEIAPWLLAGSILILFGDGGAVSTISALHFYGSMGMGVSPLVLRDVPVPITR